MNTTAVKPRPAYLQFMRCALETDACTMKDGYLVGLDALPCSTQEWLDAMRHMGLVLALPSNNGQLASSVPLDDFLPARTPVLVAPICKACAAVAKCAGLIEGEL